MALVRRLRIDDVRQPACAVELETRYDVSPRALAFALQVLSDPDAEADVRLLGALSHRLAPTPIAALDFDAQKARNLLHLTSR